MKSNVKEIHLNSHWYEHLLEFHRNGKQNSPPAERESGVGGRSNNRAPNI